MWVVLLRVRWPADHCPPLTTESLLMAGNWWLPVVSVISRITFPSLPLITFLHTPSSSSTSSSSPSSSSSSSTCYSPLTCMCPRWWLRSPPGRFRSESVRWCSSCRHLGVSTSQYRQISVRSVVSTKVERSSFEDFLYEFSSWCSIQSKVKLNSYLQLQIWRLCSRRCEGSSSSEAETRITVTQPGGLLVSEDPSEPSL